jgi:four helix bundle protein
MTPTTTITSYRDLKVWQKGMDLVVASYRLTEKLPRAELYGLVSQIRRAAISIPSNIAEGHARAHTREYLRHLSLARGSLVELETQVLAAARLRYIDEAESKSVLSTTAEIGRMLAGLARRLKERCPGP